MKYLKIIATFFTLLLLSTPTLAGGIDGKSMMAIARGDAKQIAEIFAGQTIVMKRPGDGSGYNRHLKGVPVAGTFVAYLSKNGQILIWSKDSQKIIDGVWKIGASGGKYVFCMSLSRKPQRIPCLIIKQMGSSVSDSQKGNIFNLKAGASAPTQLPYSKRLSTIQSKIK